MPEEKTAAIGFDVFEAIRSRRSVRTFSGSAVSEDDIAKIKRYAEFAGNPYRLGIEWRILDAKQHGLSSPVIVGADRYIAGKMKRAPHAEEAFGYEFEKIVLYAQSIGVGTTWIAGTMNRSAFEKAMELSDGEVMPCVSPIGYPADKMSIRESVMRNRIKADSRLDFSELFFDGVSGAPLTPENAGKLKEALEAVRLSPSAVNKQPWRMTVSDSRIDVYEKRSKGYLSQDGWDIQKIDIGIAICHLDLAIGVLGMRAELTFDEPETEARDGEIYIATCLIR